MSGCVPVGEADDPLPRVGVSEGVLGAAEGAAPHLVLSGAERTREALLASAIAVEHARVSGAVDSRITAAYASGVVDNSRRLAGCDARLHLSLLVSHRDWLQTLPAGGLR